MMRGWEVERAAGVPVGAERSAAEAGHSEDHPMLGLILGAAILGIIITAMEGGEFPGWGKMILCVLAAVIPAAVLNAVLPPALFFVGLIVGAACATVAIMLTCDMDLKRAGLAAAIYLVIQVVISLALGALVRS
jgi:hypothetical protein